MRKMNMLLVLGVSVLLSGRALAMQQGSEATTKVEEDALAIITAAETVQPTGDTLATNVIPTTAPAAQVVAPWYKKFLQMPDVKGLLAAQWAKVPSKAEFVKWHADLRAKRSFRMMENSLGVALTAVLLYQVWIYAYAQCGAEYFASQTICNGAQALEGLATRVASLATAVLEGAENWVHGPRA